MKRAQVWLLGIGMMQYLTACGAAGPEGATAASASARNLAVLPQFTVCDTLKAQTPSPTTERKPHHGVQDVLALPETVADIHAWFGYDIPVEPLADGNVHVQMDTCSNWTDLNTWQTNDAGFVDITVGAPEVLLGHHQLLHTVVADNTTAVSSVWGLPEGTHLVVFDIDGTLTINNAQFEDQYALEFFAAGYTPKAFAGAATMTQAWASKGYVPVYLTGRPHTTADITRAWLDEKSFAPGPVHLTENLVEALPTNDGVGAYKTAFLQMLVGQGYIVDYAYGNEPTDVFAYEQIGMPLNHVFTIGQKAGVDGSTALHGNYITHLAYVAAQPSAAQPFAAAH